MAETEIWHFGPFRLDLGAERLWRGTEAVRLTAKAFGVLSCLVAHAGQLLSKDTLFAAVWDGVFVSDAALAVCVRELRQALGDTAQTPQYVETVRGRGYRFVASVTSAATALGARVSELSTPVPVPRPELVVGREAELSLLQQRWVQAQQGVRQVVMVTGEAGIGKTTLVDAFVAQVRATDTLWLERGQCIEQHGAGEAYLPLLEALGRLGRGPDGTHLVQVLQQHAPSWLLHLPALLPADDFEALARRAGGTTRERMLRELAEAVEVLTAERPLVLVLEDLHWCDVSTLDWLASVAQRREAARLLVLGTYRPVDALVHGHPVHGVTQDLLRRGYSAEVALGYLSAASIATYLTRRFGSVAPLEALAQTLSQRTDGQPFFLVTVVDALVREGVLRQGSIGWELVGGQEAIAVGVPDNVRQGITQQVERCLPEAQIVLEAASVVGAEFTAAAVAAGLEQAVDTVEAHCDAFARREQFLSALRPIGWPDGTVTARYRFRHDLYREVLYERVPVSRQVLWHRQIGRRLEGGYGPQAREMAAELAEHFVRGRDTERAVQYLQYAGQQAVQRSAHQEALRHFTQGLECLSTLPESLVRNQQELDLLVALGPVLNALKGYGAREVEHTYARARALCQQTEETPQIVQVLWGLLGFYIVRAQPQIARELGEQFLTLAQRQQDPLLLLASHFAVGAAWYCLGEFVLAHEHFAQGLACYDPQQAHECLVLFGMDLVVFCRSWDSHALWYLGYPEQALTMSQTALAEASQRAHPFSLALALAYTTILHQFRREAPMVHERAAAVVTLSREQGFVYYLAWGRTLQGWSLAAQGQEIEGLALMRQGVCASRATGTEVRLPYYLTLQAEVCGHLGQGAVGLDLLAEALAQVHKSGERLGEAEAYRLQGELLLQSNGRALASGIATSERQPQPPDAEAEACFHQALAIARQQQAKSLELRAAMSLARLWQQQGKRAAGHALLVPLYHWFTEGFDTADLQEAQALLEALSD